MNFLSDLPVWATTDECKAYVTGFLAGAAVRLYRAVLRWMKGVGDHTDRHGPE